MILVWFGEVCSCCSSSLLPQLACNILATTYKHFFRPSRSRIPLLHLCGGLVSSSMTVLHKRTSSSPALWPFYDSFPSPISRTENNTVRLRSRRRIPVSRFTLFTLRRRRRAIDAIAIRNSNMSTMRAALDVSITTTDTYTQLWKFIRGAVRIVLAEGFFGWFRWYRRLFTWILGGSSWTSLCSNWRVEKSMLSLG